MTRQSILVRIDGPDPARVWSGIGDLHIPADSIEPDGASYLGGGDLLSAPDFQQLINGVAERIDLTVSGVTAEMIALAREDAVAIKGAAVNIGVISFDADWQQGEVAWIGEFRADTLTVGSQSSDPNRTRTITLSIGTDDTGRSRAPMAFFTDAEQRRRSSSDAIFSNVANISAGTSRRFGPK